MSTIIRKTLDIFIPEQYNGNYLLPTTIVGITLEKTTVVATIIKLSGTVITIEKTITQPLEKDKNNQTGSVSAALALLKKNIGHYDKLVTALPSSVVMFKELTFPFTDSEKIKMALPFEIEGLVPFALHDACIDFLITHTNPETNSATVMVGVAQQSYVTTYLQPFHDAGIEVSVITVDVMDLYDLYMHQRGSEPTGNNAVVAIEPDSTKLLFFTNGQLKHIRTVRLGSETKDQNSLWQKINFTLQAFADENIEDQTIKKVLLFTKIETEKTDSVFPIEIFSLSKFLVQTGIKSHNEQHNLHLMSFAAALPLPDGRMFTLQPDSMTDEQQSLFNRQIITGLVLAVATLLLVATHTFLQVSKLSTEVTASQQQIVKTLKTTFPNVKTTNRRDAYELARKEVKKEAAIWSAFSGQNRQSFLYYLQAMSTKIDREMLGLQLKKMVINKKTISLEGSVRSFDAVEQFEQQLKETKLFTAVPDMQKIEFSVQLPLDTTGGA